MFHRSLLLVVAFTDGVLAWQRSWAGLAIGLAVAVWLVIDDDPLDLLDPDRAS